MIQNPYIVVPFPSFPSPVVKCYLLSTDIFYDHNISGRDNTLRLDIDPRCSYCREKLYNKGSGLYIRSHPGPARISWSIWWEGTRGFCRQVPYRP